MEANRSMLRQKLIDAMVECGEEPHLYFQPDEKAKLSYPCFVYHLKTMGSRSANNKPYFSTIAFDVTYITRSSVSEVPAYLEVQPLFAFDRYYTAENLHHYAYTYTHTLLRKARQHEDHLG